MCVVNLYDVVGEKFFSPLSSKNRKVYLEVILFLNKLIQSLDEAGENDKNKIIDCLSEHLSDMHNVKFYDDENDEYYEVDNHVKALIILNRLKEFQWIFEEGLGNGNIAINFYDYSYSFIRIIEEVMLNKKRQYTGYIRIISQAISFFNYSTIDDLENIDVNLEEFIDALNSLYSNIQRYYRNIAKNKDDIELAKLLNEFTKDYRKNFFDSSYLNLKIRDNVDYSIPKMIDSLEEIFDDYLNMEKLINARIDKKDYDTYDKALLYVEEVKCNIMRNIKKIPDLINRIDRKNQKYVDRTISVIIHLISRGENIEGVLNRLIDYVKEELPTQSFINLFDLNYYSFAGLAKPRMKSTKIIPETVELNLTVSDEKQRQDIELLLEEKKYNLKNVNNFVLKFLNGTKSKKISELSIDGKYKLVMLICIMMYSKMPNAVYDLQLLEERVTKDGVSFNDFVVTERES